MPILREDAQHREMPRERATMMEGHQPTPVEVPVEHALPIVDAGRERELVPQRYPVECHLGQRLQVGTDREELVDRQPNLGRLRDDRGLDFAAVGRPPGRLRALSTAPVEPEQRRAPFVVVQIHLALVRLLQQLGLAGAGHGARVRALSRLHLPAVVAAGRFLIEELVMSVRAQVVVVGVHHLQSAAPHRKRDARRDLHWRHVGAFPVARQGYGVRAGRAHHGKENGQLRAQAGSDLRAKQSSVFPWIEVVRGIAQLGKGHRHLPVVEAMASGERATRRPGDLTGRGRPVPGDVRDLLKSRPERDGGADRGAAILLLIRESPDRQGHRSDMHLIGPNHGVLPWAFLRVRTEDGSSYQRLLQRAMHDEPEVVGAEPLDDGPTFRGGGRRVDAAEQPLELRDFEAAEEVEPKATCRGHLPRAGVVGAEVVEVVPVDVWLLANERAGLQIVEVAAQVFDRRASSREIRSERLIIEGREPQRRLLRARSGTHRRRRRAASPGRTGT